jgi:CheY-like chemotaxis protein
MTLMPNLWLWYPEGLGSIVDHANNPLILIVDDREDDRFLLERMLRRVGVVNPIHCLCDGHEAIRYFNGNFPFCDRVQYPIPEIVFLDLHMPIVHGREVLNWLHALKFMPRVFTFIYSDIQNVAEVKEFYRLGADSFLSKPINEMEVRNLVTYIPAPWILRHPETQVA